MSTRAHIIVIDSKSKHYVYHHSDGYPEGVGEEVLEFINDNPDKLNDAYEFCTALENFDKQYEFEDAGIHGDEEYIYFVDLENKTYQCYEYKYNVPEKNIQMICNNMFDEEIAIHTNKNFAERFLDYFANRVQYALSITRYNVYDKLIDLLPFVDFTIKEITNTDNEVKDLVTMCFNDTNNQLCVAFDFIWIKKENTNFWKLMYINIHES